jgi:sugar lactone lactonase YvrE
MVEVTVAASVTVFDARRCELGEGPHYDERTGRVWWVDIYGRRVLWRDLAGDGHGEFATGSDVGAAVPRRNGGLVLGLADGPVCTDDEGHSGPALATFAAADAAGGVSYAGLTPDGRAPRRRSNDAKADAAGRLWLGTIAYDDAAGAALLYRLDPGAVTPRPVLDGLTISNGLGWSPDGTRMYHVDTPTRRIDVHDFDPATGEISGRRPFADIDVGYPDGLCVDADGGVWVALWEGGAVRRYAADGQLDREVRLPTPRVTSCAFAGVGFGTLVITTAAQGQPADDPYAGRVFRHEPGDVVGLAVDRFDG